MSCDFKALESCFRDTMMSTNQSTVSLWIWTNESGPLCLEEGEAGEAALERLEVVAVGVALPATGLGVVKTLASTANIGLRLHQSNMW